MERLTKKSKYYGIYYDTFPEHRWKNADTLQRQYSELVNKLGAFEDFMEEQGFESLEELKAFVINTKQNEEPYITIDGDLLKKNLKDALDKHYRRW